MWHLWGSIYYAGDGTHKISQIAKTELINKVKILSGCSRKRYLEFFKHLQKNIWSVKKKKKKKKKIGRVFWSNAKNYIIVRILNM